MSSLYLNYFGLASPPFSITPDPRFFFEGKDRGVFIAGLLHATLQAEGIVVVIGEVGSGKTLMSRILLSRLAKHADTVYLPNPSFSRDEIIEVIARDLGIQGAAPGQGLRLEALQQELIRRYEQGRPVVVLIDEAHAMSTDSIEEIRRLSNLETDNRKLVQLVLCGQPELDTLLAAPHLRQVRDRVVYRLVLQSLSKEDSSAYLEHRLRVAGWRGSRMFSWWAERLLLHDAKGRARRLNILADKALLAAYADNQKLVQAKHVRRAIRDAVANFATPGPKGRRWPWGLLAAWAASLAVAVAVSLWFSPSLPLNRGATVSPAAPAVSAVKPPQPQALPSKVPLPSTPKTADTATKPALVAITPAPTIVALAPVATKPAPVITTPEPAIISPAPSVPAKEIAALPPASTPPVPAKAATSEGLAPEQPPLGDIGERVKQSQAYALQQSAIGHYALRLATLQFCERVPAFLANLETLLPPEQVFVRRFLNGKSKEETPQANYVIYFGSFPTAEAAKLAIDDLPEILHKEKPTIRTWKEIADAPWSE